jgi:hypothetical protein
MVPPGGHEIAGVLPASYLDGAASIEEALAKYNTDKNQTKLADPKQEALREAYASGNKSYYDASKHASEAGLGAVRPAAAPPSTPDPGFVQECRDRGGWVKNRYEWCTEGIAVHFIIDTNGKQTGFMIMNFELIGYGRDDGIRNITMFGRPTSVLFGGSYTAFTTLSWDMDCAGGDPGCSDSDSHTATMAEWVTRRLTGSWVSWTLNSDESASPDQFDALLYHFFEFKFRLAGRLVVDTGEYGVRCDSAPYFSDKPKACIFTGVIPHLQYSIKDENGNFTNQREVAEHIRQAQDNPNSTYPPEAHAKDIPGKYTGVPDDGYLNRVPGANSSYPPNDVYFANENVVRATCAPLVPPTGMDRPQCDEYPFKSTLQGAASPVWDFSVKYVTGSQNESAGAVLGNYYTADRILYFDDDRFYVEIRDQAGIPAPGPIIRTLPKVEGDEGVPIQLSATASVTGTVRWTYEPVDGVDPGTVCGFSDSSAMNPTITCNDDGTFLATITLDDGIHPTLRGQTYVIVKNKAPFVIFTEPTPWQLFRVGAAVVFNAPFLDASNDTHSCEYWFDEEPGWSPSFEPRAPHNCGTALGYSHAGMYTVTLVVTDDDGASGSVTVLIIVYDPQEGSATISGTSATPSGALVSTPNATGATHVVYQAQYPLGGSTPYNPELNGQALSWVDGAPFRMELVTMEWLVVTENGRAAGRGTGKVNGQTGYTWVVYGWDKCDSSNSGACQSISADAMRLVVFESATGRVIFDHSPGSGEYDVDRINPTSMTSGGVHIRRFPR